MRAAGGGRLRGERYLRRGVGRARADGMRTGGPRGGPGPEADGRANSARRSDDRFNPWRRGSEDRRGRGHRRYWWPYYSPFWLGYGSLGYHSPFYDPFRDLYYDGS